MLTIVQLTGMVLAVLLYLVAARWLLRGSTRGPG